MVRILTIIAGISLVLGCGNNAKPATAEKKDSTQSTAEKPAKNDVNIVTGTGDGVMIEVSRPAMLLYGVKIETDFNGLVAKAKSYAGTLLAQISNHKGVMTGSISYVYLTKPGTGAMQVFIGIPIKTRFKNPEVGEFMEIPAGRYYKMQVEAATGETLKQHGTMQKAIADLNNNIHLPAIEQFNETFDSNMSPISKATLFYPVK